ncbi:MAG: hypothetical protein Q9219_007197 [cf. Caloplaca sp. 3 TL-2023]
MANMNVDGFDQLNVSGESSVTNAGAFGSSSRPPTSESQSLIELLTAKLGSGSDTITLPRDAVLEIIQQLRPAAESEETESACQELVAVKKELQTLKSYCRLGDYSGKLFNDLKEQSYGRKHTVRATDWSESLSEAANGDKWVQVLQAFNEALDKLPLNKGKRITFETAKYAIDFYAERNRICHCGNVELKEATDWNGLGQAALRDLQELQHILPEDQAHHRDKWAAIIRYYRDSFIQPSEVHGWVPLSARLNPGSISKPLDAKLLPSLPKRARWMPFNAGQLRDTDAKEPRLRHRRIGQNQLAVSDPIQSKLVSTKGMRSFGFFGRQSNGQKPSSGRPRCPISSVSFASALPKILVSLPSTFLRIFLYSSSLLFHVALAPHHRLGGDSSFASPLRGAGDKYLPRAEKPTKHYILLPLIRLSVRSHKRLVVLESAFVW